MVTTPAKKKKERLYFVVQRYDKGHFSVVRADREPLPSSETPRIWEGTDYEEGLEIAAAATARQRVKREAEAISKKAYCVARHSPGEPCRVYRTDTYPYNFHEIIWEGKDLIEAKRISRKHNAPEPEEPRVDQHSLQGKLFG